LVLLRKWQAFQSFLNAISVQAHRWHCGSIKRRFESCSNVRLALLAALTLATLKAAAAIPKSALAKSA
jgi:hypothetical protein